MKPNKDGWIRHRGGKCPVEAGALVDTKHRDGKIVLVHHATADANMSDIGLQTIWKHRKDEFDIMYWRPHVATAEQSSEVEQSPTVKDSLTVEQANERSIRCLRGKVRC